MFPISYIAQEQRRYFEMIQTFADKGQPIPTLVLEHLSNISSVLKTSVFASIDFAEDLEKSFTYFSLGTADERPNTITYFSPSLNMSYKEVHTYSGTAGNFTLIKVSRSLI